MKNLGLEEFNLVWNGHLILKIQQIISYWDLTNLKVIGVNLKRQPSFKFTDHTTNLIEPLHTFKPSSMLPSTGYG